MVVYGESQKSEKLIGIEVSKLVNSLMGIAAVTTISMDALKGIANNIQGNIQVLIEAQGGEFFNKKNFFPSFLWPISISYIHIIFYI